MKQIYLWKKDGKAVYHTNLAAAAQLDGLTTAPEKTISEQAWEAAGGIARVVNGKIAIGKTEAEKQAEANVERILVLKRALAGTDYIAVKIAEGAADAQQYAAKIAERQAWRAEIQRLESA
jgi:hypothetical protein